VKNTEARKASIALSLMSTASVMKRFAMPTDPQKET
jgi:hypothetical protein